CGAGSGERGAGSIGRVGSGRAGVTGSGGRGAAPPRRSPRGRGGGGGGGAVDLTVEDGAGGGAGGRTAAGGAVGLPALAGSSGLGNSTMIVSPRLGTQCGCSSPFSPHRTHQARSTCTSSDAVTPATSRPRCHCRRNS